MILFTQDNLKEKKEKETEEIDKITKLLDSKKAQLLKVSSALLLISDNTSTSVNSNDLYDNTIGLKNAYIEIQSIESLCENQMQLLKNLENVTENPNSSELTLQDHQDYYFEQKKSLTNKLLELEKKLIPILNSTLDLSLLPLPTKSPVETKDILDNECTSDSPNITKDNNVLIISEQEQKAFLPFKIEDIKKIYNSPNNDYTSFDEIINKFYTLPLNKFKNSSISRFRESFKLIRNKEHGTISQALDLGLELMFNYELNPIIISACKNIEELNIYLACLEEQELYDFNCFEIRFEIAPILY